MLEIRSISAVYESFFVLSATAWKTRSTTAGRAAIVRVGKEGTCAENQIVLNKLLR